MTNIFDKIKNPDSYVYQILKYENGHKNLCIYAHKPGNYEHPDNFYIIFSLVIYFSGPTSWTGGSYFQLSDNDEEQRLVEISGYDISSIPNDYFKLYHLSFNDVPIKIVAHGVSIEKDAPNI